MQHFQKEDNIYDPLSKRTETVEDEEELKDEVHDMDVIFARNLQPIPKKLVNSALLPEEKKKHELGQKIKDTMEGFLRRSKISIVPSTREPTFITKVSKINNFDFLALRNSTNKMYKRVNQFLERYKENKA